MKIPETGRVPGFTALRTYLRLPISLQLATFLLLALPIVWGMVYFQVRQLHTIAESESKTDTHNLAHAFAEEVNSSVNTIDLSLIDLRTHWLFNRHDFRAIVERLHFHLEGNIIFQVAVTNKDGKLVFSSADPNTKPIDLSDREHVRVHRNGGGADRLFISEPVLGRVSKQWSVQFTRPLYSPSGEFDGVIIVSVSPGYFSRFYQQIDLGSDAAIAVVRSGGIILARSPQLPQGGETGRILNRPRIEQSNTLTTGHFRGISELDGIERFFAWRTLPRYGLAVIVGQSVDTAFARFRTQRQMYVLGGAGISALLVIFGYIVLSAARQRAKAVAALEESEARWSFALEGSGDGVWDLDLRDNTIHLSQRGREVLHRSEESLPGTLESLQQLVHPEDLPAVNAALRAHLEGQTPSYISEHRSRGSDGTWVWILSRGMVVKRDKDGRPLRMVGTYSDISERKAHDELIRHLAQHDPLTDLPNRALYNDRLRQALLKVRRENGSLAVIYFDLDKFKPVNDTYGHEVGDLLLKAVAARVRGCLRESDTVARVGGDEFVVLLPSISAEADAVTVANNILLQLNTPFDIDGHTLNISGSFGIATYPSDGQDEASLIRCADRAMYQAKQDGRNKIQVHEIAA
ncbi:MAG TPA: diguanylate cyclase [Noviherbaspirillum sp.]|nr:diguanylate cyclase [Noviherbaspirillum sp.]